MVWGPGVSTELWVLTLMSHQNLTVRGPGPAGSRGRDRLSLTRRCSRQRLLCSHKNCEGSQRLLPTFTTTEDSTMKSSHFLCPGWLMVEQRGHLSVYLLGISASVCYTALGCLSTPKFRWCDIKESKGSEVCRVPALRSLASTSSSVKSRHVVSAVMDHHGDKMR